MRIEDLASDFSKLEGFCVHPKGHDKCDGQLRRMESFIRQGIEEKSFFRVRETLVDLQVRVATWRQVWPRLGKDPQFRNAVAREAHAWSEKLLKLSRGSKS